MGSSVVLVGMEFEENLSTGYLASALSSAGFEPMLIPFNELEDAQSILATILRQCPVVVGVSMPFQTHATRFLELVRELRARHYDGHICLGGHFPSFEYEAIMRDYPEVDSIVRHEGEVTLPELCRRVVKGEALDQLPGVVARTPGGITIGPKQTVSNLDELAFPVRSRTPHEVLGVRCAPILGSRGCYADCSFCCINAFSRDAQGPRYRQRSPENIALEMKQEFENRGVRLFVFHDDNFLVPSKVSNIRRYSRLADCLEQAGLTNLGLVIKCRPDNVDVELFTLLKSIGLIRAYVGVESNSEEGLVSLNRRISKKDNRRALAVLNELDIYHSFNVLIFDPEASLTGVHTNLDFMEEFSESPSNFCRAEVYAGAPLKQILTQAGRLTGDYRAWNYTMRDPRVEMLFRIASIAFASRNFKCDGVANLNMGIRFDHEVFRRFYPKVARADDLMPAKLRKLSSDIAKDSVHHMRKILRFVEEEDIKNDSHVREYTIAMAQRLASRDLAFVAVIKGLKREMERLTQAANNRIVYFDSGVPKDAVGAL